MEVDGAKCSAWRRRQRRLRSMLRHERQTVAMELAAALHHRRDAGSGTHVGPTGTEDSELRAAARRPDGARAAWRGEQSRLVTWLPQCRRCAGHRLKGDDGVDGRTVRFLLQQSLALTKKKKKKKKKEEEEEEEEERRRMVQESVEQVRARVDAEFAAGHGSSSSTVKRRKRKKKRKKRLPRTCGRARHRHRRWHAPGWFPVFPAFVGRPELPGIIVGMVQDDSLLHSLSTPAVASAGLVWLVAPRAVFPVVVDRPAMPGTMAGMHQQDSNAFFSGSGMCKARFAGILHLSLCSSRCSQAHDALHHSRYEPEGQ